jgi:hypothetical protein
MMCEKTIPSIKNMASRWKKTPESLSNENAKKVLIMAKLPHPISWKTQYCALTLRITIKANQI